jgi:hypothetical protein
VQQQRGLIDQLLSGCILEGVQIARGGKNGSNGKAAMAEEVAAAAAAAATARVYIFIALAKA